MNTRPGLVVFAVIILALSALSFHGALDRFARERVTRTTTETVGIYVVTRAINAGVSVLQSADVGVKIVASASFHPGQILDPLNDATERLSGVLVWAIGSLFLQQIVLEVAAGSVFRWLVAGVGLITLIALLPLGSLRFSERVCQMLGISREMLDRSCRGAVKVFVVVAMLRFIVPVFIGCSFLFSEMLVQSHLEKDAEGLTALSSEISTERNTSPPERAELIEQKNDKTKELTALRKTEADYQRQLDEVNAELKHLKEEAGLWRFVPKRLGGKASDPKVNALEAKRKELKSKLEDMEQQIDAKNSEIECIDRIMKGKRCGSMLERLKPAEIITALADLNPMDKITSLAGSINDYMVSMARMLIALLIKNILFPLLFLYIAMKCGIYVIRRATPFVRSGMDTKLELQEEIKKLKGT